jgi:molybdopterin-dependent oxidoreductase alpha subunit
MAPFGVGHTKPHHFLEIFKTMWHNKHAPLFAWRILNEGVCDGCALGTSGLRDFTMDGVHLCTIRLNLLPFNTAGPMDIRLLEDVGALKGRSSRDLRHLGRLPSPMIRRAGDGGFLRVSWGEALDIAAKRIRESHPERVAFFLTSRGLTNETYYVGNKVARFLQTNNIDNSSRVCHAPSTTGLKETLGVAASTCSYSDWIGSDLVVFFGSDVPNNQPVSTKYLYYAKEKGTKIVVVNPLREPGLERYWIPSITRSAFFGTRLADRFFTIHTGGDIAFINGILKHLVANDWLDREFIQGHTTGFETLRDRLEGQSWELLERSSGTTRDEMLEFAKLYAEASSAVFVWSMGITQHRFGVANVKAIVNLALARGMVGRERCGLMPIRGHSGVQGGAEVGAVPNQYAMGFPVGEESATRFEALWGFRPPAAPGLTSVGMIDAAHEGKLDVLYCAGGNFLETLPEPVYVREALERVPLRIHQDLVLTSQMLVDPADTVLLFPAQTRYEQRGGGTETSTERRIYFSPEIRGRRIGETRPEWEIFMDLAERVRPEAQHLIHFEDAWQIREEIAKAVPVYDGIQLLRRKGDAVQWGGPRLCEGGVFPTQDRRARFTALTPPEVDLPPGWFLLSTRRGKQFNSIVWEEEDPLLGAPRDAVLISPEDARALGLEEGDPMVVTNDVGSFRGRCRIVPLRPRNLEMYWPESNVLIRRGVVDPSCEQPDFNALVRIESSKATAVSP